MALMVNSALPVFVTVTDFGVFIPTICEPKSRLVGDRLTSGLSPVPVKEIICVLPDTALLLSVIVSVPERPPSCVGVNVTLIVQLPLAATELPQSLVCAKSLASAPVTLILLILSGVALGLLKVTVCTPLRVPTTWLAKSKVLG